MATIKRFLETAKTILTSPRTLAIFAVLYAVLLASLYWFISTREATMMQVAITLFLLVLVPLEFFVLQSAILNHARAQKFSWKQILRDALKIAVVTIPVILIAWLLWFLLNKLQLRFPPPLPAATFPATAPKIQPMHWPSLIFATVRCLLFAVLLPLAAIHMWIEVTARDVRSSLSGGAQGILICLRGVFTRAFSSESAFTYALGLILFAAVPYALLFIPFTVKGTKTDFAVFIARLVLAFLSTLIGWIVTLTSLTLQSIEGPATIEEKASPESPAAEAVA